MSAHSRQSRLAMALASVWAMFRPRLFLLALKLAKNWLLFSPGLAFLYGGAIRRPSKRVSDSTRITVAPWSAKYRAVIGPTPIQPKSTTLRPSNIRTISDPRCLLSNDSVPLPLSHLLRRVAHQPAQYLLVMFPDMWRTKSRPGLRIVHECPMARIHDLRIQVLMRQGVEKSPRVRLGMLHQVFDVIDRCREDLFITRALKNFPLRLRGQKLGNRLVQIIDLLLCHIVSCQFRHVPLFPFLSTHEVWQFALAFHPATHGIQRWG